MSLPNVAFTIADGGLGRRTPSDDNVCGLIMSGVAATGLALGTVGHVKSIEEVEALGIDAAYDTTNTTLVYYHLREFFKANPNGELYIVLKAQTSTLANMADKTTSSGLQAMLLEAQGRIKFVGIARNPASGYTPTLTDGLDADVIAAIAKAQEIADSEFTAHRPVQILIEGRSLNGTLTSAKDLRSLDSESVCVVIGQDYTTAALNSLFNGMAAVGTVLGLIGKAKVNEDIGWPEKFRVDYDGVNWQYPAFSSHVKIESVVASDQDSLNTHGYIFLRRFTGLDGVYVQDSHTCTLITSDYAEMENVRTVYKAIRLAYAALIVKVNSPLNVDPITGKLASETVKYFEQLVNTALDEMGRNNEISVSGSTIGRDTFIDPAQNVLSTSTLYVKINIVPTATARTISVTIGLATSI